MSHRKPTTGKRTARHMTIVRARYPDAYVIGGVEVAPMNLVRPRPRIQGLMPEEHEACSALFAAQLMPSKRVCQVRARRFIRWSTGVEDDCSDPDDPDFARGSLIGEGLSAAAAWKTAAEEVEKGDRLVSGDAEMKAFRVVEDEAGRRVEWKMLGARVAEVTP